MSKIACAIASTTLDCDEQLLATCVASTDRPIRRPCLSPATELPPRAMASAVGSSRQSPPSKAVCASSRTFRNTLAPCPRAHALCLSRALAGAAVVAVARTNVPLYPQVGIPSPCTLSVVALCSAPVDCR